MAQNRGSFSALYDNTERIIQVMLDRQLKRLPNIWKKYTQVEDSDRMTEISQSVVGFDDGGRDLLFRVVRADFDAGQFGVMHEFVAAVALDHLGDALLARERLLRGRFSLLFRGRVLQILQALLKRCAVDAREPFLGQA